MTKKFISQFLPVLSEEKVDVVLNFEEKLEGTICFFNFTIDWMTQDHIDVIRVFYVDSLDDPRSHTGLSSNP